MNNIILTTNFNKIHDTNHKKAQKAGLIHFSILFLFIYSQIKAQMNGHRIKPTGQTNNHKIIHIIHHRFQYLVHQNFLVHNIGR